MHEISSKYIISQAWIDKNGKTLSSISNYILWIRADLEYISILKFLI